MKERPILFNGESVRAILEGRQTQTRRVVKASLKNTVSCRYLKKGEFPLHNEDVFLFESNESIDDVTQILYKTKKRFIGVISPFGNVGDRLWVREAFKTWGPNSEGLSGVDYSATCGDSSIKWRPSTHMPRWASRITLEITDIRVERLQDISEEDAKAEGVKRCPIQDNHLNGTKGPYSCNFWFLWETLYKDKSFDSPERWDANPWVWVVDFKVLEVKS